jgi:hypothetical protein
VDSTLNPPRLTEPDPMTNERWSALMNDPNGRLTREEMSEGWHWCLDWDDLLVGPGMMEMECCNCGWNKTNAAGFQGS